MCPLYVTPGSCGWQLYRPGSYQHCDCICNCAHPLRHVWDCKVSISHVHRWVLYVCELCVCVCMGWGGK